MAKLRKVKEIDKITEIIITGIKEKKGKNIVNIDLRKVKNTVCDYFIICHGDSTKQVEAIAEAVETEMFKAKKEKVWRKEGFENSEWILLDYVNVVVHIFNKDTRELYNIEDLWGDAQLKWVAS